jgi:N-methylhydantoinase B
MGRETIPAGGRMVLETAGGGGLGSPSERDPEAIGQDRRNGLLGR